MLVLELIVPLNIENLPSGLTAVATHSKDYSESWEEG